MTATIHSDDDTTPPWERQDGNGPVSDWRRRDWAGRYEKAPGELMLHEDRNRDARFYDFAEACRMARRDGWGVAGGKRDGETARQCAARAAMADFERLRAWCRDDWQYVGVVVTVSCNGIKLTDSYLHALWGIESDAGDYLTETANEFIDDAISDARATIASLAA
ncbi:hypothetical protein [Sphingomonas sp. CFBP 13720]|uniref:hypothetical protein n=1 Tax=Sphingomonas sp. CFBP 13720 TaxID=2775302 RepID=UPI0017862BF5|nr:hypothetical protein [Sphingomonas sp. CFBP 13720]MBD8679258.1 hypothetical protein [Sphingomonas sp. CFBP 13720]